MTVPVPRAAAPAAAALAAAVLTAGALAACGKPPSGSSGSGTPVYGGTLRLAANGDIDHLDPLSAYYTPTLQLERGYTRQLVTYPAAASYPAGTKIVPDMAAEVPSRANGGISANRLVYTFHLRPDVMWNTSPPRPVTAQDFVREFKRMCNPVVGVGNPVYYTSTIAGMNAYCKAYGNVPPTATAARLTAFQDRHNISGITAPGATTLKIRLTRPANDFLNILATAFVSAAPAEWDSYLPDSPQFKAHVYADGPYQIAQYIPGKKIVLTRNPVWKQSTDPVRHQYVQQVVVTEGVPTADAAVQDIEGGSQDGTWDLAVPPGKIAQMTSARDPDFHIYPGHNDNNYVAFSMQAGPTADLRVRQAIEYAVNKAAVSKVYGGTSVAPPISTIIPQGSIGYRPFDLYPTPGNQGSASRCKALLAHAGYTSSHPLSLAYAYRAGGAHVAVYQSISADLKACGINVTGLPVQQGNYYAYVENPANAKARKWDITEAGWVPDWFGNNGRSTLQPLLTSPCTNPTTDYGCYRNPAVGRDISRALTAKGTAAAARYWHAADVQAMKDAVYVPITNLNTALYTSSRVKNAIYDYTYVQYDITQLWLNPNTP
jgi:peptide/nickel transport system substrate-binding protein